MAALGLTPNGEAFTRGRTCDRSRRADRIEDRAPGIFSDQIGMDAAAAQTGIICSDHDIPATDAF